MAWTVTNSGTQTATGGEDTLASPTTNGSYAFWVDTNAMALGDYVTLRVYYQVDGTNYRLAFEGSYTSSQFKAAVTPFIAAFTGVRCSLQQTAGTNRAYPWQILVN